MSVLVGKPAPDFKAESAHLGKITETVLSSYRGSKYVVLFFYPLDFTFVCPTELHAFQDSLEEFRKRGVELIGCSIDSVYSHLAWLATPKKLGGIEGVEYPIVSDLQRTISSDYDVLSSDGMTYRGLFLIDREGIVRHQVINDLPLGRNVDEAIRMVDALQHFEKHGEVCPANWSKGKDAMKPSKEGTADYLSSH
ncbi:MAG: peroxiredoxin [Verrucomicrobiae bacterium]